VRLGSSDDSQSFLSGRGDVRFDVATWINDQCFARFLAAD
jgi:hypothetical protein